MVPGQGVVPRFVFPHTKSSLPSAVMIMVWCAPSAAMFVSITLSNFVPARPLVKIYSGFEKNETRLWKIVSNFVYIGTEKHSWRLEAGLE